MIPKTKQTAVKNALQATFGTGEFEDIRELTGDLTSALVYRIVVKGKPYLLRIITRDDVKEDRVRQLRLPETLAELETQLLESVASLDAGKGVNGEEVLRRLRKRMKEASA